MRKSDNKRMALALTFLLTAASSWVWAAEPVVFKIGVQFPQTGERAQVGKAMQNGVRLALETLDRRTPRPVAGLQILFEDDASVKEGALTALNRLIYDHQVDAIIGEIFSPFVLASKPIVEKQGVPFLTGGTHPKTTEDSRWIFRVGASDTLLTTMMAQYAVERLNLKRIAVLHDRTGIHAARAGLVSKSLQDKYGIVPTLIGEWNSGDKEFGAMLTRVKASGAEGLIVLGETGEAVPFLQQVKAVAPQIKIVAQRDFGAPSVLDGAKEAADGIYILTEYLPGISGPKWEAWAAEYRQQFQSEPNNIAAAYYDALILLAEAMKQGGPGREGIRAGLERTRGFPGVLGEYTFDQSHDGIRQLYVVQVRAGRPVLVETLKAAP